MPPPLSSSSSFCSSSSSVSGIVVDVASKVVAAVRDGTATQPRWMEKLQPVQFTCTNEVTETSREATRRAIIDSGVMITSNLIVSRGHGDGDGDDDEKKGDHEKGKGGVVKFAVVYNNRFKGEANAGGGGRGGGGGGGGGEDGEEKSDDIALYSRTAVIPRVAAAVEAALKKGGRIDADADADGATAAGAAGETAGSGSGVRALLSGEGMTPRVDLKDPDIVVFVEVISVPAVSFGSSADGESGAEGTENNNINSSRFAKRLAVGIVPKSAGIFEVKKKGIAPLALKAASARGGGGGGSGGGGGGGGRGGGGMRTGYTTGKHTGGGGGGGDGAGGGRKKN